MIARFRPLPFLLGFAGMVACATAVAHDGDSPDSRTGGARGSPYPIQVFEGAAGSFGLSPLKGWGEDLLVDKRVGSYRFTDLFAVEGTQTNLSLPSSGCRNDPLSKDLARSCSGAAWSLSGVATLPQGFSVYGKLGLQYLQTNGMQDRPFNRAFPQEVGTSYGIGLSYEFRKDWFLHAESERFSDIAGGVGLRPPEGGPLDSSVHSIGLSIRF
ncbi:MAG TPA: outer membrane beta-barrel protein [Burkholderiales bacterium]|nr:outer membrane beta-barrel protein [Burkholderiales bacterium]